MKKAFLILLALFLFNCPIFADELDDFSNVSRMWDGQKSITNKEFEQAIDTLEANKVKKDEKQRKKIIKKVGGGGTSLHTELNPDGEINALTPAKKNEDGMLLNIPVNLIIDETPLDKGFYKVLAEKDKNGDVYLLFYQSQFFKGKVRASETNDDYDKDTLDFVELIPYDEHFVKIIFGSLDYNAYAYVRYVE